MMNISAILKFIRRRCIQFTAKYIVRISCATTIVFHWYCAHGIEHEETRQKEHIQTHTHTHNLENSTKCKCKRAKQEKNFSPVRNEKKNSKGDWILWWVCMRMNECAIYISHRISIIFDSKFCPRYSLFQLSPRFFFTSLFVIFLGHSVVLVSVLRTHNSFSTSFLHIAHRSTSHIHVEAKAFFTFCSFFILHSIEQNIYRHSYYLFWFDSSKICRRIDSTYFV